MIYSFFCLPLHSLTQKHCARGVIGSRARLRIWCREAWGFESLRAHRKETNLLIFNRLVFIFIMIPLLGTTFGGTSHRHIKERGCVRIKFPKHSVIQTTVGRKDLNTSTSAFQILRFALNDKMKVVFRFDTPQ